MTKGGEGFKERLLTVVVLVLLVVIAKLVRKGLGKASSFLSEGEYVEKFMAVSFEIAKALWGHLDVILTELFLLVIIAELVLRRLANMAFLSNGWDDYKKSLDCTLPVIVLLANSPEIVKTAMVTVAKKRFRKEIFKERPDWTEVNAIIQQYPCAVRGTFDIRDGSTALHLVCMKKAPLDVIQKVVEYWPDSVKEKDDGGYLPLHIVCALGSPTEVVQCLIEGNDGQDSPMVKDVNGNLALHLACRHDSAETFDTIKLLVEAAPEAVKETDVAGDYPLHLASFHHLPLEAIRFIARRYPEAIHMPDKSSYSPLDLAKQTLCGKPKEENVEWLALVTARKIDVTEDGLNPECSICQEKLDLLNPSQTIETRCLHTFHRKCLEDWLNVSISRTCPDCRTRNCT